MLYPLADYPSTARALAEGSAFVAGVDLSGSDPAEVQCCTKLGYRALLAVGIFDGQRGYLVEIYCDSDHTELAVLAPHARVLAHYCVRNVTGGRNSTRACVTLSRLLPAADSWRIHLRSVSWQKVLIRNVRYSSHGRRSTSTDDDLGDSVASRASSVLAHHGGDALGHLAVVHGVAQLVRTSGVAQIDEQRDVEAQRLGDLVLVRAARRRRS